VLTVLPTIVVFAYQQGGAVPIAQTVSVNSNPPGIPFTVSASDPWIHAVGGGSTNSTISISVDPKNLAAGSHRGSVSVESSQAGNSPVVVVVDLSITAATVMSASPASLHFDWVQLGAIPTPQSVSVSASSPISFTATVSPSTPWLGVTGGGTTPAIVTVTLDPTGLAPGDYQGQVLVDAPGAANTPLIIPVTVTVSAAPLIRASPTQLTFGYQLDGKAPTPQALAITSSGTPVNVTVASSGEPWLSVVGTGGSTPSVFTVSVDGSKLAAGTYTGSITVTSTGAVNSPLSVPVALVVTAAPTLIAAPAQLSFSHQIGQAAPANQQVAVTSSSGSISFAASTSTNGSGSWLKVSGGGSTPSMIDVEVNTAGLPAGTYSGKVALTSSGAGNSPLEIPVTLVVADKVTLHASPASLGFTYPLGGSTPPSQQIQVTSSGAQVLFSASIAPGATWLSVAGDSVTPGNLTVNVNPTGLTAGDYAGTVVIQSSAAANNLLQVPVSLHVAATGALSVSPGILRFTHVSPGAAPAPQTVSVTSTGSPLEFHPAVSPGATWLHVSGSGTTPGSLQVTVDPTGLAVGQYNGTILVSSTTVDSFELVAVTLTVSTLPKLSASPTSLNFVHQIGGTPPAAQMLSITSDSGNPSVTISGSTASGGPWLSAVGSGNTPFEVPVSVNPTGLAAGTYSGTVTLTSSGAGNSPYLVPVTLVVRVAPVITAAPTSLSFAHTLGNPSLPPGQQVIISADSPVPASVVASTANGLPWLSVSYTGASTPLFVTANVNPAGLASGVHTGTITVTSSGAGNSPLLVPVLFTVSSQPVLSATPSSAKFVYTQGAAVPGQFPIVIGSTSPVTIQTSISPAVSWLTVSGGGTTTPATLQLIVNPGGLPPGTHTTAVLVTSPLAANSPLSVPVELTVFATPLLDVKPSQLTFSHQLGGPATLGQLLTVTSGGVPVNVAVVASGEPWLSVAGASGPTPAVFTVTANGSALAAGTYHAAVTVTSSGASNSPVMVPVTFVVSAAPTLEVSPAQVSFSHQIGQGGPPSKQVAVTSSSASLTFGVTYSTDSGGSWLTAAGGGSTPTTLDIAANPTGLTAGTYTGKVALTSEGAGNSPLNIPVTLVVSQAITLSASPPSLSFSSQAGGSAPASQKIQVTSSGAQVSFSASIAPGAAWLTVAGDSLTPGNLNVTVNPTGLTAGDYAGTAVIQSTAAANNPLQVPVSLHVAATGALSVSPGILRFTHVAPGSAPAPQTVSVTSTGSPLEFHPAVSPGATWLHVSGSGTTPGSLQVTVDPTGLAVGQYNGTILVSSTTVDSFELVAVTLTVSTLPKLSASPTSLNFVHQIGGTPPAAQMLSITSDSGNPSVTASASTVSGGPWLSAVGSGSTPFEVPVSVNPTGLAAGTYSGTVTLTSSGAGNSPYSVPVTLVVRIAPVITAAPTSLSFAHTLGNPSLPPGQQVIVSADSPIPASVVVSTANGLPWLSVSYTGSTTPLFVTVAVNPAGLASGVHTGTITVTSSSAGNSPLLIPVTFTVSSQPVLSATPSSAKFVYTQGGTIPGQFPILVGSTSPVTVQTSISPAVSWLTASGGGTTPTTLQLTVSPLGLLPGTYTTAVLVTSPNAANSPLSVPVELTVLAAPFLEVKPSQLTFSYQLGGPSIPSQPLTVTSGGVPVNVAAGTSGEPWLSVAGAPGPTPKVFTVTANPSSLAAGTYHATVTVTSSGASNSPVTIPVTLVVSAAPTLEASPAQVSFSHQIGQGSPPNKQVTVTSSFGSLTFGVTVSTDSGGSWLAATGGGSTPTTLDIVANPTSLTAGTYTGTVTLTSVGAGNSPLNIPVTLLVSQAITLTASPPSLSFSSQAGGGAPTSQQVYVTSSGAQVPFSTSVAPGAPWLSVVGDSATPGNLTVTVNPTGIVAGNYAGTILIQSTSAANNPLEVPISLRVSSSGALSVSQRILRFTHVSPGPAPAPQTVNVTSTGSPLQFQATVSSGATWLHVNGSGTTPGSLQVNVDPTGLPLGNFGGTILVSSSTVTSIETVLVTLSVTSLPNISSSPTSLTFQYQTGGAPPPDQTLLVTSDSGNPFVSASSTTSSGGPWLTATGSGNSPFQILVSVNPAGLAPGVYSGQVLLSSSSVSNSPYSVPVTFTVSATPVLSTDITSLTFGYTLGTPALPATQQLKVTSNGAIPVSVVPSTSNGVAWLSAVYSGTVTPLNVSVSVNPTGLSAGNHTGTISVNSPVAGNSPLLVPVKFTISPQPLLQAVPASASFVYTPGGQLPPPFLILVQSPSKVVAQASVSPPTSWLTVSGGGSTPTTLQLSSNPAGLAPGIYRSTVLVTSPAVVNSPLAIPVSLQVTSLGALVTTPSSLFLSAGVQASASADLQVQSTGAPLTFTAGSSPGTPWLTVSAAGTTPASVTVQANAAALAPGTYSGAAVITAAGAGNSPLLVPVTLTVSAAPVLTVSPDKVRFSATKSGGTQSQTITVLLDGQPATNSDAIHLRPAPWMAVLPGAPGTFVVTADPSVVEPGGYLGGVAITEATASNSPVLVPVGLGVAGVPVQLSSTSVALAAAADTKSVATEVIHIAGGPADFSVDITGSPWLKTSPTTGTIPVDLTITADAAGLIPGSYPGAVTLHAKGAQDSTIAIVFGVGSSTTTVVSPQNLTFRYNPNGIAPPAQSVAVSSVTAGIGLQIAAADGWLSVDTSFVSTPARFAVTVNAPGLAPGQYHSQITLTKIGTTAPFITVPVDLHVAQISLPRVSTISNGASFFFPAALAPGLIFSIFGSGLGPSTPVIPAISGGLLPTVAEGVQVFVNGVPCPLLYASNTQINAIASFAIDGNTTASVVVEYLGVRSDPVPLTAAPSAPGIFSQSLTGAGPGAILNLDNSVNSPSNPTTRGSFVAMFAAGGGQSVPPGLDSAIYKAAGSSPSLPVSVQVGGIDADVSYAGAAPGFVQGALQVNFRVPANVPAGENIVILKIGTAVSQPGLSVSVK
jgi:hypothetical protein